MVEVTDTDQPDGDTALMVPAAVTETLPAGVIWLMVPVTAEIVPAGVNVLIVPDGVIVLIVPDGVETLPLGVIAPIVPAGVETETVPDGVMTGKLAMDNVRVCAPPVPPMVVPSMPAEA